MALCTGSGSVLSTFCKCTVDSLHLLVTMHTMYGKHFESMYEGSMYGAGIAVFAVWGFVISHTHHSRVELNPKKLADTLGGTVDEVAGAIEFLEKPDPSSRFKGQEGRRLIKEGQFQYFVPSWAEYQKIRSENDRREYQKLKQREYREKKRLRNQPQAQERIYEKRLGDGGSD